MARSLRRKWVWLSLGLYWPMLFVLTHIPMPSVVQQAHVSDKWIHFIAYFILVFLFWGAVKPYEKVRWNRASVWWVLVLVVWYGVLDEWSQGFVRGRSADPWDLYADLGAAVGCLMLLTFFSFWPALLVSVWGSVLVMSTYARGSLAQKLPVVSVLWPIVAYGFLTGLWIVQLARKERDRCNPMASFYGFIGVWNGDARRWVLLVLALPGALWVLGVLVTVLGQPELIVHEIVLAALTTGVCVMVAGIIGHSVPVLTSPDCPEPFERF